MKNILNPTKFIYGFLEENISNNKQYMKGKLIDVGCGQKPFQNLLTNVDNYYGIDIDNNSKADLICDILDLKIADETADSVLCTQVLEHVNDPNKLVSEIARITKKGGHIIITAPHICRVHGSPHDYFRFTNNGLRYMLEKHNLKIIKIDAIKGFFLTMTYLSMFYLREKRIFRPASYILNPLFAILYQIIEPLDKDQNHTFNYLVVAKKA